MKKKSVIYFINWGIIFLVFSNLVHASVQKKDFKFAVKKLDAYFKEQGLIKKLDKDVLMFHWTTISSFKNNPIVSVKEAKEFLARETKTFWQPGPLPDNGYGILLSQGVYAAKDPFMSSRYGNNDSGVLIEMKFPSQTSYLDTRNDNSNGNDSKGNRLSLTPEILNILENAGCKTSNGAHWRWGVFNIPECKKIVFEVLKKNKVEFIRHSWHSALTFQEACTKDASAFVVISQKINKNFPIEVYTKSSFDNTNQKTQHFVMASRHRARVFWEGENGYLIEYWTKHHDLLIDESSHQFIEFKNQLIHCSGN